MDVTNSACGTGSGWSFAATSPAMWAMSTIKSAPTSRQISANFAKSSTRGYALAPAMTSFGLCPRAFAARSSKSIRWSSRRTP